MKKTKLLLESEIIGRKVTCVFQVKLKPDRRFQPSAFFVQLDTGIIFNLSALHDPDKDKPLPIWGCERESGFEPILLVEKEQNLVAPIKAVVFAPHLTDRIAVLLENGFILTTDLGEYYNWFSFCLEPEELQRKYVVMKIGSS